MAVAAAVIGALLLSCPRQPTKVEEKEEKADPFLQEWEKAGDLDEEVDGVEIQRIPVDGLPDPKLYPPVPVVKIAVKDKWARPRALIVGKVVYAKKENDGDYHYVVEDDQHNKVVCEIMPELPLNPRPKVGQIIYIWGIVRWDRQHNWGELHPVVGWKLK